MPCLVKGTMGQRRRPGRFSFLTLSLCVLSFSSVPYRYARHGPPLLTPSPAHPQPTSRTRSSPPPRRHPATTTTTMPPSYSPCPRPCLKRSSAPHPLPSPQDEPSTLLAIDPSILSPLVRFPPQPSLTRTIGNAIPYDRTPIVVQPNRCALPERGCPGRTYAPEDPSPSSSRRSKRSSLSPVRGKHLHPRAVDGRVHDDDPTPRQSPRDNFHPLPALVPDLSSSESSEESDGIASPPPEMYHGEPLFLSTHAAALVLSRCCVDP